MAIRKETVRLEADITGFTAKFAAAGAAAKGLAAELDASTATALRSFEKSAKQQQAMRELGTAAGAMGLVASAAFVGVVKSAADFDQAMSNVQAATHETSANMDLLRQAAIDAGQATVFSAGEAAARSRNWRRLASRPPTSSSGGLNGALDLAAAGGIDVAEAAETAASAHDAVRVVWSAGSAHRRPARRWCRQGAGLGGRHGHGAQAGRPGGEPDGAFDRGDDRRSGGVRVGWTGRLRRWHVVQDDAAVLDAALGSGREADEGPEPLSVRRAGQLHRADERRRQAARRA